MLYKLMLDGKTPIVDAAGLHIVCEWVDEEVMMWTRNSEVLLNYPGRLSWVAVS